MMRNLLVFGLMAIGLVSCGPSDEDLVSKIRGKYHGLYDAWYEIKIVKKEEVGGGKSCQNFNVTWEAIAKKKLALNPDSKFSTRRHQGKNLAMTPEVVVAEDMEKGLQELRAIASANVGVAGKHCGNIGRAEYKGDVDCKKFGDYEKCIKQKECSSKEHADEYVKIITRERAGKFTKTIEVGSSAFGNENTVCI